MSNFAIEGLMSGFDTTELIEAMLDNQVRGPVKQIEKRIETETEKLASTQAINANLLSLGISADSLGSSSLFSGKEATSSDDSIVSATASNSASLGSMSIKVNNLARADQVSSDLFVDTSEELNISGDFIVNGKKISVQSSDSLSSISNKINASNAGVKASIVQVAPNQNKMVINATSTGVNKIEMREVGNADILKSMGMLESDDSYDYTVNADNTGAVSTLFDSTDTFDFVDRNFTIKGPGGQHELTVNLNANTDGDGDGTLTLQEIADKINSENAAAGTNFTAQVNEEEPGKERLVISSTTGIPGEFEDPDNALFELGMVSGVQGSAFSSSTRPVADMLNIDSTLTSTVQIQDGDGSNVISVDIDLDSDSLNDIATKINEAAAAETGSDISARVIESGDLARLEITSASGMRTVTGDSIFTDDNNVMKTLGILDDSFKNYDQKGENSQFNYNGVTVNRDSNVVSDLEEGVTLTLNQESDKYVNVNIREDFGDVSSVLDDFVESYNKLAEEMDEVTHYDPEGKEHGPLFADSTMRQLQRSLSNVFSRLIPNLPSIDISELNDGNGISPGKIEITNRNGVSKEIDLTAVRTVQDVIDAINVEGKELKMEASVSSSGRSINLTDKSGGSGQFKVSEVDEGTTAADLGLDHAIYSDSISGSVIHEGGSSSLDFIGLEMNKDGTLSFNSSKLQTALNDDPDRVKNLLTADKVGFASEFKKTINRYADFGSGILNTRSESIQDRIQLHQSQIDRYERRADLMEKTLRRQFASLEVTLSQSQQVGQFLTQKLGGGGNE